MQKFNKFEKNIMMRCFQLALNGRGNVAPNPLVGCVIVNNGKIIGEGYHKKYGEPHAEVNAINSVRNKSLLKSSELYVNLEPCSHFGKTPPCADLIISKSIPKVYISCSDPFESVNGKGIERLTNAGIEVKFGLLENEGNELNKRFFTYHRKKRPFIILKWAETLDGFIDYLPEYSSSPAWITNQTCKTLVHKLRTEEQAFLVGYNTIVRDNPQLTARNWKGINPLRIVIDEFASLPMDKNVFNNDAKTLIFNSIKNEIINNIEFVKLDFQNNLVLNILKELYQKQIQSVVIEGGTKTLNLFIGLNLWDEAHVFTGNKYFYNGVNSPKINEKKFDLFKIFDSDLKIYKK